jgi:hypothetical protein
MHHGRLCGSGVRFHGAMGCSCVLQDAMVERQSTFRQHPVDAGQPYTRAVSGTWCVTGFVKLWGARARGCVLCGVLVCSDVDAVRCGCVCARRRSGARGLCAACCVGVRLYATSHVILGCDVVCGTSHDVDVPGVACHVVCECGCAFARASADCGGRSCRLRC